MRCMTIFQNRIKGLKQGKKKIIMEMDTVSSVWI